MKFYGLTKKEALSRASKYGVKVMLTQYQPKTKLSEKHQILTAPLMLAPARSAYKALKKIGLTIDPKIFINFCKYATPACIFLCLGPNSGRGRMNLAKIARARKSWFYCADPQAFKSLLCHELRSHETKAARKGYKPAARIDTVSDQGLAIELSKVFPGIMFYDYTASIDRVKYWVNNRSGLKNYYLTFSAKEHLKNWAQCIEALDLGVNVAMCVNHEKDDLPRSIKGYLTYNADDHDYRPIDPTNGKIGMIGILKPKGGKAKHDVLGFTRQHSKAALFYDMLKTSPKIKRLAIVG